jgi:hypothetical protein
MTTWYLYTDGSGQKWWSDTPPEYTKGIMLLGWTCADKMPTDTRQCVQQSAHQ